MSNFSIPKTHLGMRYSVVNASSSSCCLRCLITMPLDWSGFYLELSSKRNFKASDGTGKQKPVTQPKRQKRKRHEWRSPTMVHTSRSRLHPVSGSEVFLSIAHDRDLRKCQHHAIAHSICIYCLMQHTSWQSTAGTP